MPRELPANSRRLLILGAGALTKELVLSLAVVGQRFAEKNELLSVTIASRDKRRAEWLALLGAMRARAIRAKTRFEACPLYWNSNALEQMLRRIEPSLILNTASLQSPWALNASDQWSRLVRKCGYGVTSALQGALLPVLSRAFKSSGVQATIVNACYPDLLNLAAPLLGLPVACGIGNVALIAEVASYAFRVPRNTLKCIASHWDVVQMLRTPVSRVSLPRIWISGRRVSARRVRTLPSLAPDDSTNALNATSSAEVLCALIFQSKLLRTHVPGPKNLPGGYPVTIRAGLISCDLPRGVSIKEAIAWNSSSIQQDGAAVENDRFVFSKQCQRSLSSVSHDLASGFAVVDIEAAAESFMALRRRLQ